MKRAVFRLLFMCAIGLVFPNLNQAMAIIYKVTPPAKVHSSIQDESLSERDNYSAYENEQTIRLMRARKILRNDETVQDLFSRILNSLAKTERNCFSINDHEIKIFLSLLNKAIRERKIIFGTPILTNLGRECAPTGACTVIPLDFRKKSKNLKKAMTPYYSAGMGSGFDFSELEDPVSTIMQLNSICLEIEAQKINRPTANMGLLRVNHPKIVEFIRLKRNENFFKWRFNLSVKITDAFMQAVKSDADWELVDNAGVVTEKIRAKDLFSMIAESAHYCGEPGILFMERFERDNPVPSLSYASVAPCAEIAMAPGEVCQFSYINLGQLTIEKNGTIQVNYPELKKLVSLLVRVLDDCVQVTIDNTTNGHEQTIAKKRRVGVGICGTADLLSKLKLPFDSVDAAKTISNILSIINYHSKIVSCQLAQKRGAFPAFPESRYLNRDWSMRFKERSCNDMVSEKMWDTLWQEICRVGLRNAGTTALPPTGTSSRLIQASTSIEPLFSLTDDRQQLLKPIEESIRKELSAQDFDLSAQNEVIERIRKRGYFSDSEDVEISKELKSIYKVGNQISPKSHIHFVAQIQKHIDESVSKTVNLPQHCTVEEVKKIFLSAYNNGLKGVTVFRDQCLSERTEN